MSGIWLWVDLDQGKYLLGEFELDKGGGSEHGLWITMGNINSFGPVINGCQINRS